MTLIASTLQSFFTERLARQRQASPRTIAASPSAATSSKQAPAPTASPPPEHAPNGRASADKQRWHRLPRHGGRSPGQQRRACGQAGRQASHAWLSIAAIKS
ncbi:hypothetical protein DBP21_35255 [Streptomyces sp. CS147]|nr:hypothetical protein DBP21_35255 [Streptomyces sp. CS147]